jgi:hypothetical protein
MYHGIRELADRSPSWYRIRRDFPCGLRLAPQPLIELLTSRVKLGPRGNIYPQSLRARGSDLPNTPRTTDCHASNAPRRLMLFGVVLSRAWTIYGRRDRGLWGGRGRPWPHDICFNLAKVRHVVMNGRTCQVSLPIMPR